MECDQTIATSHRAGVSRRAERWLAHGAEATTWLKKRDSICYKLPDRRQGAVSFPKRNSPWESSCAFSYLPFLSSAPLPVAQCKGLLSGSIRFRSFTSKAQAARRSARRAKPRKAAADRFASLGVTGIGRQMHAVPVPENAVQGALAGGIRINARASAAPVVFQAS